MKEQKKRRGCLIPVLIVLIGMGAFAFIFLPRGSQVKNNTTAESILGKELNLTSEQETTMVQIFEQCGIGEIVSVSQVQAREDQTSYWVDDEETRNYSSSDYRITVYVNNSTKAVNSIYFHNQDIFIDGQVVAPITDYYVKYEDCQKYRTTSQMLINELLNYPDTAKYPAKSGWGFGIENGIVIVQSSVAAKNAFGMESTEKFQIQFEHGNPISIILDGQEYLGN